MSRPASLKPPVPATTPATDQTWQVAAPMLASMRCVLAFSALAIIWIDPSEPARLVALTYASLACYCIYSAVLALVSYRAGWPNPARGVYWADVLFFTFLVALTEGTSSIFFHFYFFAILMASHLSGYREGLRVTLASFVLFVVVGLAASPSGPAFELNRTLIRAVYLFVLGYMIAYWGGFEIALRRRLKLLQQINNQWSPRFGADHTIGANLERLLDFHNGRSCTLALRRPGAPVTYALYAASREKPGYAAIPNEITASAAAALLQLPDTLSAVYRVPTGAWWRDYRSYLAYDADLRAPTQAFREECAALANLLDARAFITVPYGQPGGAAGRIYLAVDDGRFGRSDLDFLVQASGAIATVVENITLMEGLVSRASEDERRRIARDLHDTTIQPYIGLKIALEALRRDAGADHRLAPRLAELAEMTGATIRELRGYTAALKESASAPGEHLIAAVARQVERLQKVYGLNVEVKAEISARLDGRLAAEVFQIIAEGLSNVLRHTQARRAAVSIICDEAALRLTIGNENPGGAPEAVNFTPKSILERTRALDGRMVVERASDGYTVVDVTIPL